MKINVSYKYKIALDDSPFYDYVKLEANVDYRIGNSFISNKMRVEIMKHVTDDNLRKFFDNDSEEYISKEIERMLHNKIVKNIKEKTIQEMNHKSMKDYNKQASKWKSMTVEYNNDKK